MTRQKPTTPDQYAGGLFHYDEIPPRYRLDVYASQYDGEDTYRHYVETVQLATYDTEWMRTATDRARRSWIPHMEDRGRHHALATPQDVAAWAEQLLETRQPRTCYESYYNQIYKFYDWLKHHHQHPHLHNPLLIAATRYDAVRRIWMYRITNRGDQDE